jgi:hypothetical protein
MSFTPGTKFADLTDEQCKNVLDRLAEPFEPEDIDWKPQNIKSGTATALAFADPRVYIDKLNKVLGPYNWSRKFEFTVTPYSKFVKGKAPWGSPPGTPAPPDSIVNGNKVVCVCTVTVLGSEHSSTGETDASDDNAATSSEAQSFKRACIAFGLGRYLYDLPKFDAPYAYGKFTSKPVLPDWALPKKFCETCNKQVEGLIHNGQEYSAQQIVNNAKTKYGMILCSACQKERAKK